MTANRLDEIRIEIGRRVDDIRAAGKRSIDQTTALPSRSGRALLVIEMGMGTA